MAQQLTQAQIGLLDSLLAQAKAIAEKCQESRIELRLAKSNLTANRACYAEVHQQIVSEFGEGFAPAWVPEVVGHKPEELVP